MAVTTGGTGLQCLGDAAPKEGKVRKVGTPHLYGLVHLVTGQDPAQRTPHGAQNVREPFLQGGLGRTGRPVGGRIGKDRSGKQTLPLKDRHA